jgi:hypothetical protein
MTNVFVSKDDTAGERVPGTRKMGKNRARCCFGGQPSEADLQMQASNSCKLRWSRASVANVTEKAIAYIS